jgi:hypothetical protein
MKLIRVAFLLLTLVLVSCSRDKKQIAESWVVERVMVAGANVTSEYTMNNYTETYSGGDTYSFSGDPAGNSGSGKYNWDGKKTIKRHGVSNQESMTLTVTTLTSDKFEYRTVLNGAEAEFKLRKK